MRILVAVDGSEQSQEAVRALSHLAHAEQVIVLHVLDVPKPAYPMIMPEVARDIYTISERKMRAEGERILEHATSLLPSNRGPVSTRLEVGRVAEVILTEAKNERADLIVLGTRGRGAIQELLVGSVAHRVSTHATCPVLVVNAPMPSLRSVLLAVEGAEDAEAAIRFLSLKPFKDPPDVTVLTALTFAQEPWPLGGRETESLKENTVKAAWNFVWDVTSQLSTSKYLTCGLVAMGDPSKAIIQHASAIKADLTLLGSRRRQGITRFVLGSVSHAVLHQSPCPVLIFR